MIIVRVGDASICFVSKSIISKKGNGQGRRAFADDIYCYKKLCSIILYFEITLSKKKILAS
jgi:hypothetical protein